MNSLSKTLNIFLWLGLDWTHQPLKYATIFFKWIFANNRCFVWYMYLYLKKYVYNKNIGTCIYGYLIYLLVLLLLLGFFLNWWVWILYWHSPVNWNCHIVNCKFSCKVWLPNLHYDILWTLLLHPPIHQNCNVYNFVFTHI